MNNAIFYKEWIKTRWYIMALLVVGLIIEGIMFLKLGRSFRFAGHEHLWDVIVNKHQFMFSYIKFYPLVTGLVLASSQFVPETNSFRLKLSLHLPMPETRAISLMLGFSSALLFLLFASLMTILLLGAGYFFASEIVSSIFITVLPWFMVGFVGYFLLSFCIFEPLWKRRLVNLLISIFVIYIFFVRSHPGAYMHVVPLVLLIPLVSVLLVYYSAYRFKIGVQA